MAGIKDSTTLEQQVLHFIREQGLVREPEKLVVAVSGGPDSVCLLYVLVNLRAQLGITLHVAHLNHQLRGVEAEADARYVTNLARKLKIPATIESREVRSYRAKRRISLEEAAREVRYHFLAEVARSTGAERVAVGHTLDDHIETILMHLIRGSGIRGLRGLLPINQYPTPANSITVIRPLLSVSREETADYCRRHRLNPRLDVTNLSLSPLRNRIRQQLLPLLRRYNPGVAEALLRTARIATDDLAFLEEKAGEWWDRVARVEGKTIILDKAKLLSLQPALKRLLLIKTMEALLGTLKDVEARHIEELMEALDKPAGKVITLPEGLIFSIEYDRFLVGADPAALCPFPPIAGEYRLEIPGETRLPGWLIEATVLTPPPAEIRPEDDFSACFDFDKTGARVVLRSRRPGDRFQPLGMSQPKKLNEFMIDAKIPQTWRQRVPIVSSDEQILWVVGWRINERARVTEATRRVLCLKMVRM